MTLTSAPCPYVGLQPFREEDYPYFFGREREIRVISANVLAQPLTIVYGASGVGKTSVLRAGVLPRLSTHASAVAVYHNTWQSQSFLSDLTAQCRAALQLTDSDAPLDQLAAAGGRRLFLLLDQFEELLLYHRIGEASDEFDAVLARMINGDDLAVNVVIGIRDDALSLFDQKYSIRIADLLGNTLPLDHLTGEAGRRAILEPMRVFNERHGSSPHDYSVETELADEILREVQSREYAEMDATDWSTGSAPVEARRVQTPFLQLVLRRLWNEEMDAGSRVLRLTTLRRIGGAGLIVDKHVNDVLASMPRDHDREIAARIFKFLVTPSRSKISQATEDLVAYAEASEADLRKVVSWLSDRPDSRILRRIENPERYEIFHDVIAQPILDWRKKYFAEKERLAEEDARRKESARVWREVRRLRWTLGVMMLLALVAIGFAWYALAQRGRAREALDLAQTERQRADSASNEARIAQNLAEARAAEIQARQAELNGQKELAARFEKQADSFKKTALAEHGRLLEQLADKGKQTSTPPVVASPLRPVFFENESSDLTFEGKLALNENAAVLRRYPSWVITVEGHADERGTAEHNLELGERRALAAKSYLVSLGISSDRVRTVSYGREFPFDQARTESAAAKNRRAHFVVTAK